MRVEAGLVIILKLVLLFLALAAILYLLARFLHGTLYTEIPGDLYWRAPAAAAVLCLAGLAPAALANREGNTVWPVTFNDLFLFSSGRTELEFKAFEVKGRRYDRRLTGDGRIQYRDAQGVPLPATPEAMVGITGEGQKVTLAIKKDPDGYVDRSGGMVRYTDPDGREMTGEQFGSIVSSSSGPVFLTLFVMILSWGVWFACWWLLLRFAWPQALGFSLAAFLAWTLTLNFAW